jgi:hypothetical protein
MKALSTATDHECPCRILLRASSSWQLLICDTHAGCSPSLAAKEEHMRPSIAWSVHVAVTYGKFLAVSMLRKFASFGHTTSLEPRDWGDSSIPR